MCALYKRWPGYKRVMQKEFKKLKPENQLVVRW